jgi:hypothetical protein
MIANTKTFGIDFSHTLQIALLAFHTYSNGDAEVKTLYLFPEV